MPRRTAQVNATPVTQDVLAREELKASHASGALRLDPEIPLMDDEGGHNAYVSSRPPAPISKLSPVARSVVDGLIFVADQAKTDILVQDLLDALETAGISCSCKKAALARRMKKLDAAPSDEDSGRAHAYDGDLELIVTPNPVDDTEFDLKTLVPWAKSAECLCENPDKHIKTSFFRGTSTPSSDIFLRDAFLEQESIVNKHIQVARCTKLTERSTGPLALPGGPRISPRRGNAYFYASRHYFCAICRATSQIASARSLSKHCQRRHKGLGRQSALVLFPIETWKAANAMSTFCQRFARVPLFLNSHLEMSEVPDEQTPDDLACFKRAGRVAHRFTRRVANY